MRVGGPDSSTTPPFKVIAPSFSAAARQRQSDRTVPKPKTSNSRARGQFGRPDFRYVASEDMYLGPADEVLVFVSHKRETDGLMREIHETVGSDASRAAVRRSWHNSPSVSGVDTHRPTALTSDAMRWA